MASVCSLAMSRRRCHVDAVLLDLVGVPAEADAEHEPTAALAVQRGDGLGRHDRVALGHETDAGADHQAVGHRRRHRQGDERVERALVLLGQFGVPRGWRGPAADRDVRVLGHVERAQPPVLDLAGEVDRPDRLVGQEHRHTELHVPTPCENPFRRDFRLTVTRGHRKPDVRRESGISFHPRRSDRTGE